MRGSLREGIVIGVPFIFTNSEQLHATNFDYIMYRATMRWRSSETSTTHTINAILLVFQVCLTAAAVYFQGLLNSHNCTVCLYYLAVGTPIGNKIRLTMNPTIINASAKTTPTVTLTCRCSTAIILAKSVVWRRNYIEIPPSELQSNSSQYSSYFDVDGGIAGFTIHSPQPGDSGTYDCKALVNGSYVTSLAAEVTIASKLSTHGYGVVRGLDVQVHCPVENTIPSHFPVFWSKDGSELLSGKKYQHSNHRTMTIVKADYRDSGVYHCVVVTAEGRKNGQLRVTVQGIDGQTD